MPSGVYERAEKHRQKKSKGRECWVENHVCYIPLQNGEVAFCDEDRFEEVNKHNWLLSSKGYPYFGTTKRPRPTLHRFLYSKFQMIDHINGNKLDNRSCNLRECTNSENLMNRPKQKNNTSGYKGVHFHAGAKKFSASIGGKYIGSFSDPITAAKAYDKKASGLFGDRARLNFPEAAL